VFYDPRSDDHGLAHNPFTALVVPRPIAWVSSVSAEGVPNLAPYSFSNFVGGQPPFFMFSSLGKKDSQRNIEATEEFVVNMAVASLVDQVVASSAPLPEDVDEFEFAKLEKASCKNVSVPRVAASPVALECKLNSIVPLVTKEGIKGDSELIIGEVVGIHISEDVIVDGILDLRVAKPLTRLGYLDYAIVDELFEAERPSS
jgi:flavin reductase (DIM6/NTAB) family NADH-FMN oxidoreductase RutF